MRKPRVKKPRKLVPARPRGECVLCGGQLWTQGKPGDHREGCPQGKGLETRRVKREELERVLSRMKRREGREMARDVVQAMIVPPVVEPVAPAYPYSATDGSSLPLLFSLPEVRTAPRRPAVSRGWVCPVCGAGVAPGVERCPCARGTMSLVEEQP